MLRIDVVDIQVQFLANQVFEVREKNLLKNKGHSGLGQDHTLRVVVLDDGLEVGDMAPMWRVMVVMSVMTTPFSFSNQ
ncbi:hypothetical protein Hanom_Chr03g00227561 [Helianthus anomalus]